MSSMSGIFKSSLGKKYLMAGTGLVLLSFVIGHLIGNLQVFGPPELINRYAEFLHSKPALLWSARLGLLAVLVIHIGTAARLTIENKAARPVGYAGGVAFGSTWASRHMFLSGAVILAFVVYHLAHFTWRLPAVNGLGDFTKLQTVLDGKTVPDVYGIMILGFQVWWVVLLYLIAQILLLAHLSHGIASAFFSLGLRNQVWAPRLKRAGLILSVALFLGFVSIPAAIFTRVIGADYAEKARLELRAATQFEAALAQGKEAK